jgi:plasmid stability protein
MASITIRNIEDQLKSDLRIRAARQGHSMEEEARQILREALQMERQPSLASLARSLFGPEGGIDLDAPPVVTPRNPMDFDPT